MKQGNLRLWMLRGGVILGVMLLVVILFSMFSNSGHDPNHGIDREQARAAANRVHPPPKLTPEERAKAEQDHGG